MKLLLLSALVVGVLYLGGVLEIKIHNDQWSQVPGRIMSFVGNKETQEKVYASVVGFKREVEQQLNSDNQRKFQLAVGYVKADADRLQKLSQENNVSAAQLLPQAKLLSQSVDLARKYGEKVPIETLAHSKDDNRAAFAKASEVLKSLDNLQTQQASMQDQYKKITDTLRSGIRYIAGDPAQDSKVPAVAGARDEASKPSISPTPKPLSTLAPINAIPINF